jgi:hypothetical protein
MANEKSAKQHPMIAALLNQMPAAAADWPIEKRVEWLNMLAMSFNMVFSPVATIHIGMTHVTFTRDAGPAAAALAPAAADRPVVAKPHPPRLFIDLQGFARRDPGGALREVGKEFPRIMPSEVGSDVLFDDRGELGDLGSITWADDSRGVLGLQLDISATPVKVA